MNNKNSTRNRIIGFFTILCGLITLAMLFVVNRLVPFMMDDLWYQTILSDENVMLSSIGDIFKAQVWHYNNWGGRSMTHTILQLTLLQGPLFADILNTIVTVVLANVVLVTSGFWNTVRESRIRAFTYVVLIVGMLLGLNANWKMSMFWQSGAANYLYITVFILLFINCYIRVLDAPKQDYPLVYVWIVFLGILSGWSNENMGPVCFLVAAGTIIFLKKKQRATPVWMYEGAIASLAGSIMCIIAPGNFVRSAEDSASEYGIIWKLYLRCFAELRSATEFIYPALIITIMAVFILVCVAGEKLLYREWFLLVGALLSWGAMVLSPHYPDRAAFGTIALLITATISMVARILNKKNELTVPIVLVGALIWCKGFYYLLEFASMCWGWIQ